MLWETQILPPALRCSATVTQVHPWRLSGHCIKVTEEKGGSTHTHTHTHTWMLMQDQDTT